MAKIRFSDKIAEVQGQLAEGGFMDKPSIGDYLTVAAQNLATGLQAAEKERMIIEKEKRAEAAAKAERIRKEQLEEEKRVKKLKAAINSALDIELESKKNIDWQWNKMGGKPSVVNNIFGVLDAMDIDPSQVSGYVNMAYDRGMFVDAAIPRDITLDTQTIDEQTDSALGISSTPSAIDLVNKYYKDEELIVNYGSEKINVFAPRNVSTESTWQQSIVDIQNATYGQLRKDAEIAAIKQKAKDMGWVTVGDRTLKEIKDMKTSEEVVDWAATQNLNQEDAATVEAVIDVKKDVEDRKLWFNQPVSKIIEWNYDGDKNKKSLLEAQIIIQKSLSEDKKNLSVAKRTRALEKYEKLLTAKATIAMLDGKAEFSEVQDLIPYMGKDVTELTNLRAILVSLEAPTEVQEMMGFIISQAIEKRDAELQQRRSLLGPKEKAFMDFRASKEYKDGVESGTSIMQLEARFEKNWKELTSIAQQSKSWFEKPENLASLTLDKVNLLIDAQIIKEGDPAYETITNIKVSLEGAQTDDDIEDFSKRITEAANKQGKAAVKALELLINEIGVGTLLSNDQLANQLGEAMAIANEYTEPEQIDEYQMVLRAAVADAEKNKVDFSEMSADELSKFFGEVKLNYDAARTITKDESYNIENFRSDLVKFSLALANDPNDKAAKDWLDKQAPVIESQLLRVSGLNAEAQMLAKLANRGLDDTPENRKAITRAEDLFITTSYSGYPMLVDKLNQSGEIIGSGDDVEATVPATMDSLNNTLTDMKNNPSEYNYIGKVSVAEDGALTIDVRGGQTITLTADQVRESAEFEKSELLAMSQAVQEGIPMSQGPGSYVREILAAISDISFGLPPESDRAKTTAAIGFLEKLKINTILKLSAAQGTRDSVWQKQALSITLPERGLFKGNQLALQEFENALSGLRQTKAILDDIMAESRTVEGSIGKATVSKSARTLKDMNSLIPVYEAVIAALRGENTSTGTTTGSGRSGKITDLNLQKGSFTTDEGENK